MLYVSTIYGKRYSVQSEWDNPDGRSRRITSSRPLEYNNIVLFNSISTKWYINTDVSEQKLNLFYMDILVTIGC